MLTSKPGNKPAMVELGLATSAVNLTVRSMLSGIEKTTHGILSVMNLGCKKKVSRVSNELLLQPAAQLAAKIRRGELSSEEVVKAYISRIGEVNGFLNAVIDSRYSDALEEARNVDKFVRSGIYTEAQMAEEYPLLGVPFTAKESLLIKDLSSTCGLVCRKGLTAAEDCAPVQRMRACGAIPVALTNTSEICMWWETYNKLHGRTNNPYDTTRTVGGSSEYLDALSEFHHQKCWIGLQHSIGILYFFYFGVLFSPLLTRKVSNDREMTNFVLFAYKTAGFLTVRLSLGILSIVSETVQVKTIF